jgi:hypothetical protein
MPVKDDCNPAVHAIKPSSIYQYPTAFEGRPTPGYGTHALQGALYTASTVFRPENLRRRVEHFDHLYTTNWPHAVHVSTVAALRSRRVSSSVVDRPQRARQIAFTYDGRCAPQPGPYLYVCGAGVAVTGAAAVRALWR